MVTHIDMDLSELNEFFEKLGTAAKGDFKRELSSFLEAVGYDFLRIMHDEIIRLKVMDTRLLLRSFALGGDNGVWKLEDGGLTLEVGTTVDYASYANDGHWTNPKGTAARWVPGHWNGDRFTYDPSSKEGMLLKQHWVEGSHYWESGLRILEKTFPKLLDRKLQEWIDRYFGG